VNGATSEFSDGAGNAAPCNEKLFVGKSDPTNWVVKNPPLAEKLNGRFQNVTSVSVIDFASAPLVHLYDNAVTAVSGMLVKFAGLVMLAELKVMLPTPLEPALFTQS
jgi:hypothetical protein